MDDAQRPSPDRGLEAREALRWIGGLHGHVEILDHRHCPHPPLPPTARPVRLTTAEAVIDALRDGAIADPAAIGLAVGYALVLAARQVPTTSQASQLLAQLQSTRMAIRAALPAANDLPSIVDHLLHVAEQERAVGVRPLQVRLFQEVQGIHPTPEA